MSMYNTAMLKYHAASMIGKIKEAVDKMIVSELGQHGIEGIVPSHGGILSFLYQENQLSVKELTEKIHRTQPTVTVLVKKLESLGYVERKKSEEDQRITLICLTEKGRQLEPIFRDISARLNEQLYGGLQEEEKKQLERLLETILNRF